MGGFYGVFFLHNKPELEWPNPVLGNVKGNISGRHFEISHSGNDKFPRDKFLLDPPGYAVGIDGVILNRKVLVDQFAADSWEALFVERFLHDPQAALNLPQGEFNGIFIDKLRNRITLFVNHKGTKPMFYFQKEDALIFSPDYLQLVRALGPEYKLTPNEEGMNHFLSKSFFPGNWTHFLEIKRLRAGEMLHFDGELHITKYVDWNNIEYNSQFLAANTGDLHDLFLNAVRLQFNKDREEGYQHTCTLSGGLDSRMTVMYAHKDGYRNKVHITTSESHYADETIARQIAADLGEELRFHPLDEATHLLDMDTNTSLNGGLVAYSGSAHMLEMYGEILPKNAGLIHSGQLGDGFMQAFVPRLGFERKKVSDAAANVYKNSEMELLYNKAFNSVNNGSWTTEKYSYLVSPFMQRDVMEFLLSVPPSQRWNSLLYFNWIERFMPEAKKYKWEKINLYPTIFNHKAGLLLNRFRIGLRNKIIGHEHGTSMNPYRYWFKKHKNLNTFYQDIYVNEKERLMSMPGILKKAEKQFESGSIPLKLNTISLLNFLKLIDYH